MNLDSWLDAGVLAVRIGGALHFVQLPAMAGLWFTIQRHRLREHVPAPLQRILLVLGGGIVLAVASGGILAVNLDRNLLTSWFGFGFTLSWSVFWAYRLAAQLFVYGPVLPAQARVPHRLLTLVFTVKTAAFCFATYVALCYHC